MPLSILISVWLPYGSNNLPLHMLLSVLRASRRSTLDLDNDEDSEFRRCEKERPQRRQRLVEAAVESFALLAIEVKNCFEKRRCGALLFGAWF